MKMHYTSSSIWFAAGGPKIAILIPLPFFFLFRLYFFAFNTFGDLFFLFQDTKASQAPEQA